ncbi:MAG: hypothetical protein R2800_03320 [Flavipsychrobacter sp.]
MSTRSESHPVHAHDVADLTAGGSSYNGVPGDGTADDWGEASWYPGNVDLGKVLEHDHPGETTISLGSGLDYEAYDPFTGVVGSYTT